MITIRRRQILALTAAFMTSVSGVALAQSTYPESDRQNHRPVHAGDRYGHDCTGGRSATE